MLKTVASKFFDFMEDPGEGLLPTLLFTVMAFGLMAACMGLAALAAVLFGWYALGALVGGVLLACIYVAGVSHGRQT